MKRMKIVTNTPGGFSPYLYDVERILEELGVEVTKAGDDEIKAHCPGHQRLTGSEDRNPSWSINRDTGLHNCWSCGFSGDLLYLVCEVLGVDHWEALRWLRNQGIDFSAFQLLRERQQREQSEEIFEIPELALSRFADPPTRALVARNLTREAVMNYGVRWDRRSKGWICPLYSAEGNFMGYQLKADRFVRNRPKDMKKSKSLFGLPQFKPGNIALIVEAPLDVVRFASIDWSPWQDIEPNIQGLACIGSRVSDAQMKIIMELTDSIIMALDNPRIDKAGKIESRRIKHNYSKRIHMKFFEYGRSKGKDIGEMSDEQIVVGLRKSVLSALVQL